MSITTLGAVAQKLIDNGFAPTSGLQPGAFDYKVADDPAAILCIPQRRSDCGLDDYDKRRVLALTVTVRDSKIRAQIAAILAKHGLGKGPIRTDSAGNETHILRCDSYNAPTSQASAVAPGESSPAVALDAFHYSTKTGSHDSAIVRLPGDWKNGDLLTVKRSALPTLADISGLFREIEAIFREPYVEPELPPALAAAIAARRKENDARKAQLAKRNDPEILAIVERRRPGINRLEPWNVPSQDQRELETITIYDEIVAERAAAADLARRKAALGIGG
jgi:hypothetical protein